MFGLRSVVGAAKRSGSIKIREHLDNIELVCECITIFGRETINMALGLKDKYGYSYFDCLMLASALENDCVYIFIEDMNDGQIIDGRLKIVNPFKGLR